MGKLLGNWKLDTSENWDEFMTAMGVNIILRKVASTLSSNEEIKLNGDDWEINITSTFKNKSVKFKLGETWDDNTMDGRLVRSTFKFEDGVLILDQIHTTEGEPDTHVTRKIADGDDDTLLQTMTLVKENIVAVRTYRRYTP